MVLVMLNLLPDEISESLQHLGAPMEASKGRLSIKRRRSGAQLMEFAAAITVLALVIIPLVDLSLVPVRWMLVQELVNGYSRQLAFCETFGQCCQMLEADASFKEKLKSFSGVGIDYAKVQMRITRIGGEGRPQEELIVSHPREIPPAWLPNGAKGPCIYALDLQVRSAIAPAVLMPKSSIASVPGLNAPFEFSISSSREWANLGRNPLTNKFFLNE
jgi:hypothetical protein